MSHCPNYSIEEISKYSLINLVNHLIDYYHHETRRKLNQIIWLSSKVKKNKNLIKNTSIKKLILEINRLNEELLEHMSKEENVLFPLIKNGNGKLAYLPIKIMQKEHELHDLIFKEIKTHIENLKKKIIQSNFLHYLFVAIENLDKITVDHVYIEDNILSIRLLLVEEEL